MNWTTDKPTEPGWYWWREGSEMEHVYGRPKIIRLMIMAAGDGGAGVLMVDNHPNPQLLPSTGEWAGPIHPPPDAVSRHEAAHTLPKSEFDGKNETDGSPLTPDSMLVSGATDPKMILIKAGDWKCTLVNCPIHGWGERCGCDTIDGLQRQVAALVATAK